jgi:hypothetical protein
MNLLTIIGNAALDKAFRDQLLDTDPVGTAHRYGFHLTIDEADALSNILAKRAELQKNFQSLDDTLSVVICPQKPCRFAIHSASARPQPGQVAAD